MNTLTTKQAATLLNLSVSQFLKIAIKNGWQPVTHSRDKNWDASQVEAYKQLLARCYTSKQARQSLGGLSNEGLRFVMKANGCSQPIYGHWLKEDIDREVTRRGQTERPKD